MRRAASCYLRGKSAPNDLFSYRTDQSRSRQTDGEDAQPVVVRAAQAGPELPPVGLPLLRWYRMSIRTLSTREVYRNPWLRVREDQIERSNGVPGIYGVVDKDDCAIILPIQGDTVYLVEQFRYTIQRRCLEFPQGGWETADVDAEELARGELHEETGLIAADMTYLGTLLIAYGFANQKQHVYLAAGLRRDGGDPNPDPEEHDLVLRTTTIPAFEEMLLDGTIQDASTIAAWGLYRLWRERQRS